MAIFWRTKNHNILTSPAAVPSGQPYPNFQNTLPNNVSNPPSYRTYEMPGPLVRVSRPDINPYLMLQGQQRTGMYCL